MNAEEDQDRIIYGVEGGKSTGIINGPVRASFKKEGSDKWEDLGEVKSLGLEGPYKDGYAGFEADIVIIDDIVSDDNGVLAQERRKICRDYFLDTVSAAALRNTRR